MTTLMNRTYPAPSLAARVAEAAATVGLVCVAMLGCHTDAASASGAAGLASSASSAPSAAAGMVSAAPRSSAWQRARSSGDAIDLAAVANEAGAAELAGALDDPEMSDVARRALPFATDRELAIATLAARVKANAGSSDADLDALIEITGVPPTIHERLDPDGVHAAFADLLAVAKDASRPAATRARCVTVLRRWVNAGVGDASAIPTDLD